MTAPENGDRVTNRQLYDALSELEDKFASKADVKLWVGIGLIGGQVCASAVTTLLTGMGPPAQVSALAQFVSSFF